MDPDEFKPKIGLLLSVPLLALAVLAGYSALDWLFVEETGWIAIDQELVATWIPFAIAVLLAFAVVDPKVKILMIDLERVNLLYTLVAIATIAVPTIIAQHYVHAASGTLAHVDDARAIASKPCARYFQAGHVCLDRVNPAVDAVAEVGGRHNENLRFLLYIAVPLCGDDNGVRIGLRYTETVDNRLSDAEKDARYRAFIDRSREAFDSEDPARYTYLERLAPSAELRGFARALEKQGASTDAVIVVPHTDPFEQRMGNALGWMAGTFAAGVAVWLLMVLWPEVDPEKIRPRAETEEDSEMVAGVLGLLLLPRREDWGLALLLDVNILVYIAMAIAGLGVVSVQADDLIVWGGNYGPALHGLGWLRLIGSQFVHAGLMHVANNMYGLVFAGLFLMPVARNARLAGAYLACGLGGNIASAWLHPDIVSVGASGAIFGLYGILLALVALGDARLAEARPLIFVNGAIFVGLNLVLGLMTPGIDNAAHIGGLATGLVLGAAMFLIDRPRLGG
ncbi:MAG TPA: rhomboid family intramembrane serine protease [Rhizomicrobium sp.]|nr:rhomboid family intramembrane serine protease [Rhizomicrobium sp.]